MKNKTLPLRSVRIMCVGAHSFCNTRIAFTENSFVANIQSDFPTKVQTHIKFLISNFRTKMLPVLCRGYNHQFVPLYQYQCCQWQFEKQYHHQHVCSHHSKGKYLNITLYFNNSTMKVRTAAFPVLC